MDMPASTMAVFRTESEYEEVLRHVAGVRVIVTGRSEFSVRLTQVELQQLRIWEVHECASLIGFLTIPPDRLLALFTIGDQPSPIWSGISLKKEEILICGPGHRLHMRTTGPCCWGGVSLPAEEFKAYFNRVTGQVPTMPNLDQRCRPSAAGCKRFTRLHAAAIRAAGIRPQTVIDFEAAHGLEQQLIHCLVRCLAAGPSEDAASSRRCQEIVVNFEDALQALSERYEDLTALRAALAVSDGLLRRCCRIILGVGPATYVRLHFADRGRRAPAGNQRGDCHITVTG
jgi:hypothetical protein